MVSTSDSRVKHPHPHLLMPKQQRHTRLYTNGEWEREPNNSSSSRSSSERTEREKKHTHTHKIMCSKQTHKTIYSAGRLHWLWSVRAVCVCICSELMYVFLYIFLEAMTGEGIFKVTFGQGYNFNISPCRRFFLCSSSSSFLISMLFPGECEQASMRERASERVNEQSVW